MKISNIKNAPLASKNKDNPNRDKPLFSPRSNGLKPTEVKQGLSYQPVNNHPQPKHNGPVLVNNKFTVERQSNSPQIFKQNQHVLQNRSTMLNQQNQPYFTSKAKDQKTIQLRQFPDNTTQFQNQYQTIHQFGNSHNNTVNKLNSTASSPQLTAFSTQFPYQHIESPQQVYGNAGLVYRGQSPLSSPKEVYHTDLQHVSQGQSQKSSLSKSKIFGSGSLKKQQSSVGKLSDRKLGLGVQRQQNKGKLTERTCEIDGSSSDKLNGGAPEYLLQSNNNTKTKRKFFKMRTKKQQPSEQNQQPTSGLNYEGAIQTQLTPSSEYLESDLNPLISPGFSPRPSSKKKMNFLRLSKSLQTNLTPKSKLKIESSKLSNKISFDKMYDEEDFQAKNQLKQSQSYQNYQNYQNDEWQSMANSEQERKMLTSMESELKRKKMGKKNNRMVSMKISDPFVLKNNNSKDALPAVMEEEDEKTRVKIPSFRNPHQVGQDDSYSGIPMNTYNQQNNSHHQMLTTHDQYMIRTKDLNDGNNNTNRMTKSPRISLKLPAQQTTPNQQQPYYYTTPSPQTIQLPTTQKFSTQQPITTPPTIIHNHLITNNHQPNNPPPPLQVINFTTTNNTKFPPTTIDHNTNHLHSSQFLIISHRTNEATRPHLLPTTFTQPPQPQTLIRPHSSMSQFYNSKINENGSIHQGKEHPTITSGINHQQGGSLSPEIESRRPQSQAVRPLMRFQAMNVQETSKLSNRVGDGGCGNVNNNNNSNLLKLNSSIKSHLIVDCEGLEGQVKGSNPATAILAQQMTHKPQNSSIVFPSKQQTTFKLNSFNAPSTNSKVSPSSPSPIKNLSSIIMGMKSYTSNINNNSYFNQLTTNQQNVNTLAYNEVQTTRTNNHIQNNNNKPSSASSRGQISSIENNNLPIDSKPNSPQYFGLGDDGRSVVYGGNNNAREQRGRTSQNLNGYYETSEDNNDVRPLSHVDNQSCGLLAHVPSITNDINQSNKIQISINTRPETHISANPYFEQQPSPNPNHHLTPRALTPNNPPPTSTTPTSPYPMAHLIPLHHKPQNNQVSHTHQDWLNINRQKYSTSEYLNVDQMKVRLETIHTGETYRSVASNNGGYSNSSHSQRELGRLEEEDVQDYQGEGRERQHVRVQFDDYGGKKKQEFYHVKGGSDYVNDPVQIRKLNEIQKDHEEFRTKINSISQNLLSMTPIKMDPPIHQNPTQTNQSLATDRTKEITSQDNHYPQPPESIDYEYSEDNSSLSDQPSERMNFRTESQFSNNKDLSDTRKITHAYGQKSTKRSSNKMLNNKKSSSKLISKPLSKNDDNSKIYTKRTSPTRSPNEASDPNHKKAQIMVSNSNFSQQLWEYHKLPKPSFHEISSTQIIAIDPGYKLQDSMRGHTLTDSMKRQMAADGQVLYTPIDSSEINELSSLNSLSFHFVATNYQPSKNSLKPGSLLVSSKANVSSFKNLQQGHEKHTGVGGEYNLIRSENIVESNEQGKLALHNRRLKDSQHGALKESRYGVGQDSVNYNPISRSHPNIDSSSAAYQTHKKPQNNHSPKLLDLDSNSQVQYYESRYEQASSEYLGGNQYLGNNNEDEFYYHAKYHKNDMEDEKSFSNVIETMNFNREIDFENQYRNQL